MAVGVVVAVRAVLGQEQIFLLLRGHHTLLSSAVVDLAALLAQRALREAILLFLLLHPMVAGSADGGLELQRLTLGVMVVAVEEAQVQPQGEAGIRRTHPPNKAIMVVRGLAQEARHIMAAAVAADLHLARGQAARRRRALLPQAEMGALAQRPQFQELL